MWIIRMCNSHRLCIGYMYYMREKDLFSYRWAPSCIGRQKDSAATWSGSIIRQSETGLVPLSWAKRDSSSSLTDSTRHMSACSAADSTAAGCLTADTSTETPNLRRLAMTPSSDISAQALNCTILFFCCCPPFNSSTCPELSIFGCRHPVKTTALSGWLSMRGQGVAKSLWMTCPSSKREQLTGKPDTGVCKAEKLSFTNWRNEEFLNSQWVSRSQVRPLIKSQCVRPRRDWKNDASSFWTQRLFG